MARDRFFIEGRHRLGDSIGFTRDDAHKIVDVLRKRPGDRVVVVDSASQEFTASLSLDGNALKGRLDEALPARTSESAREIALAQAIPKGQKMDFVVEKATELGVARIIPFGSARSIADASPHKLDRWRKLARAAAQQAGRARIPEVDDALDFSALLARMRAFDATLFAWELATGSLREALAATRGAQSLLVVVGPEGGFSHDEAEAAFAAGARAVSLGPRILRAETSPLVLLAAILYDSGEL